MSLTVVDDLEAAEERIRSVQEELEHVATHLHDDEHTGDATFEECPMAQCVRARQHLEPFVRPSCEDGDCDDTCGGYHPEREDDTHE